MSGQDDGSEPYACDLRMVRPDGTPCWTHLTVVAARDAEGAPVARMVLTDISERKQAETEKSDLDHRPGPGPGRGDRDPARPRRGAAGAQRTRPWLIVQDLPAG